MQIFYPLTVVKENAYKFKSLENVKIWNFCRKILAMKNRFSRLNGVKIVSNMSQSVRNIINSDQKHILDLNKSHKDRLKKDPHPPP